MQFSISISLTNSPPHYSTMERSVSMESERDLDRPDSTCFVLLAYATYLSYKIGGINIAEDLI